MGTRGRNRDGILWPLSTLTLQSLLTPSFDRIPQGPEAEELITWLHSAQEDVRGKLLLFLEKSGFSDKRGRYCVAFLLTRPFLPCSNEDMLTEGHHPSCCNQSWGNRHEGEGWGLGRIIGVWVYGGVVKQAHQLLQPLSWDFYYKSLYFNLIQVLQDIARSFQRFCLQLVWGNTIKSIFLKMIPKR